MFKFLLVVHALISASLVGIILMQRSEGGGLAGGGSPTGMLSARGAGDFLTRTTAILATLFVTLSIAIAALASFNRGPRELDESLKRAPVTAPAVPTVPMAGGAQPATQPIAAPAVPPTLPILPNNATPKADEKQAAPKVERKEATPAKRDAAVAPKPPVKIDLPPIATPAAPKVDATPAVPAPTPPQ